MRHPTSNGLFVRAAVAALITCGFSLAFGVERERCEEKGPCCELDWTGQGATIVKMAGEVLVSQSAYVSATLGMRVENGGRVMTLAESSAVVAFDDGCWQVLEENELLTIEDVSPCCAVHTLEPRGAPPPLLPAWVMPAAAATVIGGLIIADDNDDDEELTPISR